jgi:hypothetical protein
MSIERKKNMQMDKNIFRDSFSKIFSEFYQGGSTVEDANESIF